MPPVYLSIPPFFFFFSRLWIIFLSLLWILFQVDSALLPRLFGLVGFYHISSPAAYFSVFSLYLVYCRVCPVGVAGWTNALWRFPGWRSCVCVLVGGAGSRLSKGKCHVQSWVLVCLWFWYGLGSLSAHVRGCVPVLLKNWHGVFGNCVLLDFRWIWF